MMARAILVLLLASGSLPVWGMKTGGARVGQRKPLERVVAAVQAQNVFLLKAALVQCEQRHEEIDATELINYLASSWSRENTKIKVVIGAAITGMGTAGAYNMYDSSRSAPFMYGIVAPLVFYAQWLLAHPEERFFELVQLLFNSPIILINQENLTSVAHQLVQQADQYARDKQLFNGIVVSEEVMQKVSKK